MTALRWVNSGKGVSAGAKERVLSGEQANFAGIARKERKQFGDTYAIGTVREERDQWVTRHTAR